VFDLAVGTVEERPITFRVSARRAGASGGAAALQVDYTVTTPYRWDIHPVDLSDLGGSSATIELSLISDTPGSLGFWGAPVIRSRGTPAAMSAAGVSAGLGDAPQGVILIHADTVRRDHLEAYGYSRKTAPAIARMAEEGVLFKNAIAQAAWTKASTPSIMTSLYPSTVGVQHVNDRVPSSATTLAEAFRAAGYATFSVSSVSFTGQHSNLHQGFEELHENGSLGPPNTPFRIKTAREYVDRTIDWIARHRDVPFFTFLHAMDAHSPYEPYRPYDAMWADPSRKEEHVRQVREVSKIIADPALRSRGLPSRAEVIKAGFDADAYIQQEIDWYDGSIRGMDAELARLFERLKAWGLDERTLVVLYSDHGDEFHEHGGMFHEHSVYGELTNVPLIVRWPGRVPRRSVDENVQLIDIMPTLIDLSRLDAPKLMQGQSLLPFLRADSSGASWKPRPAISEAESITPNPDPARAFSMRAIVEGQWKLIHKSIRAEGEAEFELYDQLKDPLNKHDLASQKPEVVARLKKALDGWREMARAARLKPDAETTKGLSAEELQRLRSLGYVR
jgi:arylsulfatase A-like enzyme